MTATTEDVTVITVGICFLSLCVPAEFTAEEVEQAANWLQPTGISSAWSISDEPTFSGGQTNPCECERGPSHKHYLLSC